LVNLDRQVGAIGQIDQEHSLEGDRNLGDGSEIHLAHLGAHVNQAPGREIQGAARRERRATVLQHGGQADGVHDLVRPQADGWLDAVRQVGERLARKSRAFIIGGRFIGADAYGNNLRVTQGG
jgi:hypothetical protein